MDHYLLTLDVVHDRLRMHGYLMCKDQRYLPGAYDRMLDAAENLAKELGTRIFMPTVLATGPLTPSGRKLVRGILVQHSPEVKELLRTAKTHHFTIWVWSTNGNPDDESLMALH